jgi:arsenate reductase
MPDPAEVAGDEASKRRAFAEALQLVSRRIDLMLALPMEKLERFALEGRLRAIGREGVESVASEP